MNVKCASTGCVTLSVYYFIFNLFIIWLVNGNAVGVIKMVYLKM